MFCLFRSHTPIGEPRGSERYPNGLGVEVFKALTLYGIRLLKSQTFNVFGEWWTAHNVHKLCDTANNRGSCTSLIMGFSLHEMLQYIAVR